MNEQIVTLIDKAISSCSGRGIVSTAEMVDILLDMRILAIGCAEEVTKEEEVMQ